MIRPNQPHNPFTPDAEKRWKVIPEWAQREILCNVFCSRCSGSVPIVLEKAEMRLQGLKSSVTDVITTAAICGLAMTTPQITCERTFVV